jgi:hypothetical protein
MKQIIALEILALPFKKEMTSRQIAKKIHRPPQRVSFVLRILCEYNFMKKINKNGKIYFYKF